MRQRRVGTNSRAATSLPLATMHIPPNSSNTQPLPSLPLQTPSQSIGLNTTKTVSHRPGYSYRTISSSFTEEIDDDSSSSAQIEVNKSENNHSGTKKAMPTTTNKNKVKNRENEPDTSEIRENNEQHKNSEKYHLMDNGNTQSNSSDRTLDETSLALRKLLEQEKTVRKTVESKLEVFRDQNSQLVTELTNMTKLLSDKHEELETIQLQLDKMKGKSEAILLLSEIEDCEELEGMLKETLKAVKERKEKLIMTKIDQQTEERLCVVCQNQVKSVLLLPVSQSL